MLSDMKFESEWEKVPEKDKLKFLARQVYDLRRDVDSIKFQRVIAGAASGGIVSAVVSGTLIGLYLFWDWIRGK
uniref:Uncharacterized protein n=1 Tax=viral metagenome TaxID=1070528 RepID=A0A6M3LMJ5_9ZZZZ